MSKSAGEPDEWYMTIDFKTQLFLKVRLAEPLARNVMAAVAVRQMDISRRIPQLGIDAIENTAKIFFASLQ